MGPSGTGPWLTLPPSARYAWPTRPGCACSCAPNARSGAPACAISSDLPRYWLLGVRALHIGERITVGRSAIGFCNGSGSLVIQAPGAKLEMERYDRVAEAIPLAE